MGTRSQITFIRKSKDKETPLVTICQQYDGYIDGVGKELARWLNKKVMINGIGFGQDQPKFVNGVGCLAAKFVADFKTRTGNLYITDLNPDWIDYNYFVIIEDRIDLPEDGLPVNDITKIIVKGWEAKDVIFEGSPSELLLFNEDEWQ